jgi:hypothetical protein
MLYIAADDLESADDSSPSLPSLEGNCLRMMDQLAKTTISSDVQIVALFDSNARSKVKRNLLSSIKVRKSNPVGWENVSEEVGRSHEIEFYCNEHNQPELDTGNYHTLKDFIRWAIKKFNPNNTMLAIIGHGGGWAPTLSSDRRFPPYYPLSELIGQSTSITNIVLPQPGKTNIVLPQPGKSDGGEWAPGLNGLCPDYTTKKAISTAQLGEALRLGRDGRKLDVVFLDACLMGTLEVAYELHAHVNYIVAGQNLLWARLPYHDYLLGVDRNTTSEQLAKKIVQNYNKEAPNKSWAIAAIKTEHLPDIKNLMNDLAIALQKAISIDDSVIINIRDALFKSQKFDYNADGEVMGFEGYADLFDFCLRLRARLGQSQQFQKGNEPVVAAYHILTSMLAKLCVKERMVDPPDINQLGRQAELDDVLKDCKDGDIVISMRVQQEPDDELKVLNNAYGLLIYFPLFERERYVDGTEKLLNKYGKRYLDFYCEAGQAFFTREAPEWAELLKYLDTDVWISSERRKGQSPLYNTPRQQFE